MLGTQYFIHILDAHAFHRYLDFLHKEYGVSRIFEPLSSNNTKIFQAATPYTIYLENESQYGAIIRVEPDAEENNEEAQREFLSTIHWFNIWPQLVEET